MQRNQKEISANGIMLLFLAVITALALKEGLLGSDLGYKISMVSFPAFILLLFTYQRKSKRN